MVENNLTQVWEKYYKDKKIETALKDHNFFSLEVNAILNQLFNESLNMKKSNLKILEIGCGTGFFANQLYSFLENKSINFRYIGIDFSKNAIKKAKNRKIKKCKFIQTDFIKFLKNNKTNFDFIISQRTIMAIMDPLSQTQLLKLIKKSLTMNGVGVFSEISGQAYKKILKLRKNLGVSLLEKVWHSKHIDENEIKSIFSKSKKIDFSSTYWLITRVIYPYFQKPKQNTKLHNFASKLSQCGNYGLVKLFVVHR